MFSNAPCSHVTVTPKARAQEERSMEGWIHGSIMHGCIDTWSNLVTLTMMTMMMMVRGAKSRDPQSILETRAKGSRDQSRRGSQRASEPASFFLSSSCLLCLLGIARYGSTGSKKHEKGLYEGPWDRVKHDICGYARVSVCLSVWPTQKHTHRRQRGKWELE